MISPNGIPILLRDVYKRQQILETVVEESNGSVPVIAHVGALSTKQAVRLAVHARECGADAVSSIPPLYYPYGLAEIAGYYRTISEAVSYTHLDVYKRQVIT